MELYLIFKILILVLMVIFYSGMLITKKDKDKLEDKDIWEIEVKENRKFLDLNLFENIFNRKANKMVRIYLWECHWVYTFAKDYKPNFSNKEEQKYYIAKTKDSRWWKFKKRYIVNSTTDEINGLIVYLPSYTLVEKMIKDLKKYSILN